jgi:four helix bundle protein
MREFRKLNVWQKGLNLAKDTYLFSNELNDEKHYSLADQIRRSAISIPSNIAEGSSRRSDKEYYRFMEIALGSSFELETQLLIAESFTEKEVTDLLERNVELQKMISGFMRAL